MDDRGVAAPELPYVTPEAKAVGCVHSHELGIFRRTEDQKPFGEGQKSLLLASTISGSSDYHGLSRCDDGTSYRSSEQRSRQQASDEPAPGLHAASDVRLKDISTLFDGSWGCSSRGP